jgi:hypothetical protein
MPPPPVPKKKHERGLVTVTVVAARNLRDCERFGNMDPYVTVRLDDSAHSTAVVAKGGTDCEFGDVLTYHVEERPTVLLVDAWDKERVGKDDHVGQGELPLSRGAKIVGETMTAWVPLLAKGLGPVWQGEPTDMEAGEVQLQVRFTKDGTPLVISGYLDKRSASWPSWDRHWCELRGTALVFFNEDASGVRRAAGEVSLLECSGVRSSAAPDAREAEWELVHEKRTFRLAAASDEEAISWMDACRSVIPGLAEAAAGDASPTRGDAMADGDATPRGRSAPREAALVRKYLAAMTGKPAKGQVRVEPSPPPSFHSADSNPNPHSPGCVCCTTAHDCCGRLMGTRFAGHV